MRLLRRLFRGPPRTPRGVHLLAGAGLLGLVAALDWLTGPDFDFSLFYLLPVCYVTWHLRRRYGYLTSLGSAVVWLGVDRLTGAKTSDPLVAPWNMGVRLLFFSGSVLLLNRWKNEERNLSRLVEERTHSLSRLAVQLSAAEDAERRKLAYDIHDTLSQTLSLIKINLDSAQLESADRRPLNERLCACGTMVDDVIQQCRTLMFDLHPAMLDDLGLLPTLQWYAADFERRTGTELLAVEQGQPLPLPAAVTNYLYRAAKELIGNAVRHGRAKSVIATLHWERGGLRLVVDDDGVGFDATAEHADPAGGFGLAGIDERVRSMGGSVQIESTTSHGTRVILQVPLEPQGAPHAATRPPG